MIDVRNLCVVKSKKIILDNISVKLNHPRFHMIVGPNGAGKTHLLKAICAGDYDKGKIEFDNDKLAWMPNKLELPFNYTTESLLLMSRFSLHKGFPKKEDYLNVGKNLDFVGLSSKAQQSFNSLSSGEQAKVQIAWLLATEADTLVFDEPVAHLDIRARIEILRILKKLSADKTIIISHHDLSSVTNFADEVHFIKNGKMIASGATSSIFNAQNIRTVFEVNCDITTEGYIHFLD